VHLSGCKKKKNEIPSEGEKPNDVGGLRRKEGSFSAKKGGPFMVDRRGRLRECLIPSTSG